MMSLIGNSTGLSENLILSCDRVVDNEVDSRIVGCVKWPLIKVYL